MKILFVLLTVLFVCTIAAAAPKDDRALIRVFLGEPASEFTDPDLTDSVADLHYKFKYQTKLKAVEFVRRQDADVYIEVIARARRPSGSSIGFIMPNGFGGLIGASRARSETLVCIRITAGSQRTYTHDIAGTGGHTWSEAAYDASVQIKRWLDANRKRIVAIRPIQP